MAQTAAPRIPFRSSNPALNAETFSDLATAPREDRMTLAGTVNRTAVLLAITVGTAALTWNTFVRSGFEAIRPWMWAGVWGGLAVALTTVIRPTWSAVTAPLYTLLEGIALGGISAAMERAFPGIVIQAVCLTFGTLGVLLAAYRTGWIRPTENFKLGVAAATGGVAVVYLISLGLRLFGREIPLIHESGMVGIGFSLFTVTIAALNLVLDFDFIESGVRQRAPRYMEWYGAFGLMVTLIWLYLEILRLLAKSRSRK